MSQIKQLAIDVLEGVIDSLEKQLEKAKSELEKLKSNGDIATTLDGPVTDPVPPDPTHPQG